MKRLHWRNRKPGWWVAAASGILALGLLASLGMASRHKSSEPQVADEAVSANGIVEGARRTVELRTEVAGTLKAINVRVGEDVEAGKLLFELHNEAQQAQVALGQAQLKVAAAQRDQAKAEHDRSEQVRKTHPGAVSEQSRDADRFRLAATQAKLEEAQAQLKLAEAELAKTQVKAPCSGRVMQVYVEPGATVGPGSAQPVLLLADLSRRRVRAFVEELDVGRVRVGWRAVVTAEGFPNQQFAGRVAELLPVMGKSGPRSEEAGEYVDVHFREALIDLDGGDELPVNLRVRVRIEGKNPSRP